MRVGIIVLLASVCSAALAAHEPGAADWERGLGHYKAEDYREAQRAFESAVGADPDCSTYRLWLGLSIGRRAESMTGLRALGAVSLARQTRQHFEQAVELDRADLDALESLHGFHTRAPGIVGGSKAEARRIAARIEEIDPARGAAAWAALHETEGDFKRAEAQHLVARERAPDDIGHLVRHAGFLARRGRHAASDELFETALERAPGNPSVWLGAGQAWIQAKRKSKYPRAKDLLERYLASPDRETNSTAPSAVRKLLRAK